jgi:hypothetical protein
MMSGGSEVKMSCQNARSLAPSYLDGELSEEQAAPLRTHFLDCVGCRETVKQGTAVKRWFQAQSVLDERIEVPDGFASRVARRAFAGDPGVLVPHAVDAVPAGSLLPFVLKLSALAAGLLFVFSIGIRMTSLPSGAGMNALEKQPWELQEQPADWPLDSEEADESEGVRDAAGETGEGE